MTITPLAGTSQIATALTALGTTAFGDSETELYTQLLVALSEGGPAPVWTPADIADLAIFFWFKPGEGTCFSDVAGTTPSAAGGAVKNVTALYGAQVTEATEATNFPTLQSDGLQLDAAGVELLSFSSQFSATDITVYWSMIVDAGSSVACFASDTAQGSLLGGSADISIFDNGTNGYNLPIVASALTLGRFNMDAAGNYSMCASGETPNVGSALNSGFDFNQIGGIGTIGAGNDSESNRFRLVIAIKRAIALDSAEDLLIRNWISTNDGASL